MITSHPTSPNHLVCHAQPRPHLHVHEDWEGHPFATIPTEWMWDVVEYLSYHRLNLSYHFDNLAFRVVFLCRSARAAQELLDDWTASAVDDQAFLEHHDAY